MNVKQNVVTGISVTLNGGEKEMNSATIPIAWWLSEEVIERTPKYILIFEQDEWEKKSIDRCMVSGRRYVCKVSDAVTFMPVFSPGYHRVMVIAVSDHHALAADTTRKYLKEKEEGNKKDCFCLHLDWEMARDNALEHDEREFVAAAVVEFEVPQELFAKRSETKTSWLIWEWVNRWHERRPQDECDYRRRMLFAFTIQPPLMAVWWTLKYGIGGTVGALYILLASFVMLFFGFRPRPLFREMWLVFTFAPNRGCDVRRYDALDIHQRSVYRVWSITDTTKDGKRVQEVKYMPVAPFVVVLIGALCVDAYQGLKPELFLCVIGIIVAGLFAQKISLFFSTFREAVSGRIRKIVGNGERKAFAQQKKRRDMEQRWMLENLALSKKTEAVHLDRLPIPLDLRERVVQRFRVGYWTLKAKVCRPFATR